MQDAAQVVGRSFGPGGRYRVLAPIARGGMGAVYRARDARLEREVAVKVLDAALTRDPTFVERFHREAQLVAQLEHGHILPVYDSGEDAGLFYLVTRLVRGGTLKTRLQQTPGTPRPPDEALALARQVLPALDYAHGRDVVHRDVKPANILLEGDWAYLADFGIAKILQENGGQALTHTGAMVGTPAYMAPEQAMGKPLDGRADLYAFGVVLYELLTGCLPYRGDTPLELAVQHLQTPLPPARQHNPALPVRVEAVLARALAKTPDARYPSGAALEAALAQAIAEAATAARPPIVPAAPGGSIGRAAVAASVAPAAPGGSAGAAATGVAGAVAAGAAPRLGPADAATPTPAGAPPPGSLCPQCRRPVQPDWLFCRACGAPLRPHASGTESRNALGPAAAGAPRAAAPSGPPTPAPASADTPWHALAAGAPPAVPTTAAPAGATPWQVFAGSGGSGSAPGQFHSPLRLAVDAQGNVYVVELGNHRVQKLSPTGQPLGHAGTRGNRPGQFESPEGLAVDGQGSIYVADTGNHRVQKLAPAGQPLAQWGRRGAGPGQFNAPAAVAVDAQGSLYVADSGNHRIVKLSPAGQLLGQLGARGRAPGQFDAPAGVALDRQGNLYVADARNRRIQQFSPTGRLLAHWALPAAAAGQPLLPAAIALDAAGNVYVADFAGHRVLKLSPGGDLLASWGQAGRGPGQFDRPAGVALDPQGSLYVAESGNHRIQKLPAAAHR